jgi:hypothetical protein
MVPHKLLMVKSLFMGGPLSKIQSLYSSDKLILGFPPDTVIVWDLVHCIFNVFREVLYKTAEPYGLRHRLRLLAGRADDYSAQDQK